MTALLAILLLILIAGAVLLTTPRLREVSRGGESSVSSATSISSSSSTYSVAHSTSSSSSARPVASTSPSLPFLSVPEGFSIDVFAKGLPNARVMVQDAFGNFWLSRPSDNAVTLLTVQEGQVVKHHDVFRDLRRPHGLAIDHQNGLDLYIVEEHRIVRARLYSDAPLEEVATLPGVGRHWTRTLGFGPDDRLYISIGSTCDVCNEEDDRHGTIMSMNRDGSDLHTVAMGLRNAVFFTWSYVDGRMWATEMGRDHVGDDLPPDEVNLIEEGKHYGWPYCYGKQIRDTRFNAWEEFDCSKTEPSKVDLQAHVAPLGLAFIPEEGWPEEYWYDLLVAEHGSWNRSTLVGYRISRIPLDANGNQEGPVQPFISGWLDGAIKHGRPVGLLAEPGGILYITDDFSGRVYRMTRSAQ